MATDSRVLYQMEQLNAMLKRLALAAERIVEAVETISAAVESDEPPSDVVEG